MSKFNPMISQMKYQPPQMELPVSQPATPGASAGMTMNPLRDEALLNQSYGRVAQKNYFDVGGMMGSAANKIGQEAGAFYTGLGKAFSNFGKAMNTPGFAPMFFGQIAAGMNPRSSAGQIGQAMAGIGQNIGFKGAYDKLQSGQKLTPWEQSFVSPEQHMQMTQMGLQGRQVASQEAVGTARVRNLAPYEEQFAHETQLSQAGIEAGLESDAMKYLSDLMNPEDAPTTFTAPTGPGGEQSRMYMKMNPETGSWEPVTISTGTPKDTGTDTGELTSAQRLSQSKFYVQMVNQAREQANYDPSLLALQKYTIDPITNRIMHNFADEEVRAAYNAAVKNILGGYTQNPYVGLPKEFAAPYQQEERKVGW